MEYEDDDESLAAFRGAHPLRQGPDAAWLTQIPEWDAICRAYANGMDGPSIRRWLIEVKGYDEAEVTLGKFQHLYKSQARRGRS